MAPKVWCKFEWACNYLCAGISIFSPEISREWKSRIIFSVSLKHKTLTPYPSSLKKTIAFAVNPFTVSLCYILTTVSFDCLGGSTRKSPEDADVLIVEWFAVPYHKSQTVECQSGARTKINPGVLNSSTA